MARKRVVSRTIKATKCVALCVDTETTEISNKTVMLSGTFEDEKAMLKAAQKQIDTDTFKAVSVSAHDIVEKLYKMDEAKFMELADEIVDASADEADTEE